MKITDYKDAKPQFIVEDYFQGKTVAHGFFQDRFGNVKRRFKVDINGEWNAKKQTLTLVEDFVYDDGEQEQRIWTIHKKSANRYTGNAAGVIGDAQGESSGNALRWRYDFDLPVGDGTLRVHFDDWMFLQDDEIMINRAEVRKFGIQIGEVIISFRKL